MLWKFILVNSNDLSHIGELSQARDKKLEVVLNKPGAASFTYPMDADYAALISSVQDGHQGAAVESPCNSSSRQGCVGLHVVGLRAADR